MDKESERSLIPRWFRRGPTLCINKTIAPAIRRCFHSISRSSPLQTCCARLSLIQWLRALASRPITSSSSPYDCHWRFDAVAHTCTLRRRCVRDERRRTWGVDGCARGTRECGCGWQTAALSSACASHPIDSIAELCAFLPFVQPTEKISVHRAEAL